MQIRTRLSLTLAASAALITACGGGGGGGGDASPAVPPAPPAITVATLVPGAAMTWATGSGQRLAVQVRDPSGQPVPGAGVRVFTLSRTSPQDGRALDEPVPLTLLGSAESDNAGGAGLTLQVPGHVTELLVVATHQDAAGQRTLTLAESDGAGQGGEALVLTLKR